MNILCSRRIWFNFELDLVASDKCINIVSGQGLQVELASSFHDNLVYLFICSRLPGALLIVVNAHTARQRTVPKKNTPIP